MIGEREAGERLAASRGVALVSATGSVRMGYAVAQRVAARLGRHLLELGGNNAAIVRRTADLDLAVRGIVFAAVGTAGQRCTSPAPADRPRSRFTTTSLAAPEGGLRQRADRRPAEPRARWSAR